LGDKFAALQLVVNQLSGPLRGMASGLMGISSPATAAASAIVAIGDGLADLAKFSVESFGALESVKTQLLTVTGSAEKADSVFNQLQSFQSSSPFDIQTLTTAATTLLQTGTNVSDLTDRLGMLSDVARGNSDLFNRFAVNWGQISSQMKASSVDIKQFAMAGIPIYKVMNEMGLQGELTADQMVEAFRRMTSEGGVFYRATELGATTLKGRQDQLRSSWTEFGATLADVTGIGEAWKEMLTGLNFVVRNLTDTLSKSKFVIEQLNELAGRGNLLPDLFPDQKSPDEVIEEINSFNQSYNDLVKSINTQYQSTSQAQENAILAKISELRAARDALYTIEKQASPFLLTR
jgi:hypothetical protein